MSSDVEHENRAHYEQAYSSRSFLITIAKLFVSYDQLSKTRRNLRHLRKATHGIASGQIVDYGFGNGSLLVRLPRDWDVVGCELSESAIANMERLFRLLRRSGRFIQPAEFFSEAWGQAEVDAIVCSHVMEHVEDDKALLSRFHRCLRPGGVLIINVPVNEVWRDPKHVRDYEQPELANLLRRSGFEVEAAEEADRWTAFILTKEYVDTVRFRWATRFLRLILALLPEGLVNYSERMLPAECKSQQLIMVARKRAADLCEIHERQGSQVNDKSSAA